MREGGVTLKFDITKPFSKINKDQSGNLISTSFSFWDVCPRQLWPGLGSLEEQQVRAIYLIRYSRLSFVTSTCQTRFRWPVKGQLRPCWIINLPTLLLLKLKKLFENVTVANVWYSREFKHEVKQNGKITYYFERIITDSPCLVLLHSFVEPILTPVLW